MNPFKAVKRTEQLLEEFGIVGWHAELDRSVRRFGQTRFMVKTIGLSRKLVQLNDEATVEDTIRHEIAHVLAGPEAKHGYQWRLMCAITGAEPERCYDAAQINTVAAPWVLLCPNCEAEYPRHRKTTLKPGRYYGCRKCGSKLEWKRRG